MSGEPAKRTFDERVAEEAALPWDDHTLLSVVGYELGQLDAARLLIRRYLDTGGPRGDLLAAMGERVGEMMVYAATVVLALAQQPKLSVFGMGRATELAGMIEVFAAGDSPFNPQNYINNVPAVARERISAIATGRDAAFRVGELTDIEKARLRRLRDRRD